MANKLPEKPLISVVIPARNEEGYIDRLLKSIKKQTYKNYEILVGDYKSTDKTREIARKYGAKVFTTKKAGVSAGRNICLKHARGDIIAFIDADYVIPKNLFSSIVEQFKTSSRDVVGITPIQEINKREIPKSKRLKFKLIEKLSLPILKSKLLTINTFGCVFCMADAVKRAGYFSEKITIAEDIDFYRRVRKHGKFILGKVPVKISVRRFIKQGIIKPAIDYLNADFNVTLTRKYKKPLSEVRLK